MAALLRCLSDTGTSPDAGVRGGGVRTAISPLDHSTLLFLELRHRNHAVL